jgi:enolase
MFHLESVEALEILDSRGRPTLKTRCRLRGGAEATASVPSGASTGAAEAREIRDGDLKRYEGHGCRRAAANVNEAINEALAGSVFANQEALDQALIAFDGSADKSRLGANAVLSVSLAFARAAARQMGLSLFQYFAAMAGLTPRALPRPMINLFSGGKHAGAQSPIQDTLVAPVSVRTIDEALTMTYSVYQAATRHIARRYGMRALSADEGGLAPPFPQPEAMVEDALLAIREAGLRAGDDMALAMDVAASHFFREGRYELGERALSGPEMIEELATWVARYPIVSVEDGLAEDDWVHWPALRARLHGRALVVGDDLLCTNPTRIARAIETRAADALLLKVNQIGTLSEALQAMRLARQAGWRVIASARSGETEDDWLADLAVGWGADQIKVGSITQSERLSKYNRLLEIEATTRLPLAEG